MSKISNPTKSFLVLFFLAIFGTCLAILLSLSKINKTYPTQETYYSEDTKILQNTSTTETEKSVTVDTSSWKTYSKDGLSFKYPAEWKIINPVKKDDYQVLQIDPGSKYYNIKIYISSSDFYVMSGLPSTTETINGLQATNVGNLLYGIQNNNKFYTFDIGISLSLKPYFNALVHSVEIK